MTKSPSRHCPDVAWVLTNCSTAVLPDVDVSSSCEVGNSGACESPLKRHLKHVCSPVTIDSQRSTPGCSFPAHAAGAECRVAKRIGRHKNHACTRIAEKRRRSESAMNSLASTPPQLSPVWMVDETMRLCSPNEDLASLAPLYVPERINA